MINQRLSNPIFLYFISSWIICNWDRVLLLIFAFSLNIEARIEKLKALPSNSIFFGFNIPHAHTIWYPFIATVFFVIGTPFVSYCIDLIHNGVINKRNLNDSNRMQSELDLKMLEISKKAQYAHKDEQERLAQKKKTSEIEFDIAALDKSYKKLKDDIALLESIIKSKALEVESLREEYEVLFNSVSEVRKLLDSRNNDLKNVNSDIVKNNKILDDIKNRIYSSKLPAGVIGPLSAGLLGGEDFFNRKNTVEGMGLGKLLVNPSNDDK